MKLVPTSQLNFIRSIANMRLNNFGADIYTDKSGKAYIVCDKLGNQVPNANIVFSSLNDLEQWLDEIPGSGAGKLDTVLERLIS